MKTLIFALLFSTFSIVYTMKDDYITDDPSALQEGNAYNSITLSYLEPHLKHNIKGFGKSCNEKSYLKILDNLEKVQVTNLDECLDEINNWVDSANSLYQENVNAHTFKVTEKDDKIIYETASDESVIFRSLIHKITKEAKKQKKEGKIKSTTIDKGRDLLLKLQSFNEKIENDNCKKDLETITECIFSITIEKDNCKNSLETVVDKAKNLLFTVSALLKVKNDNCKNYLENEEERLENIRFTMLAIILISQARSLYIENHVNNYSIKMGDIIKRNELHTKRKRELVYIYTDCKYVKNL